MPNLPLTPTLSCNVIRPVSLMCILAVSSVIIVNSLVVHEPNLNLPTSSLSTTNSCSIEPTLNAPLGASIPTPNLLLTSS